MKTMLSSLGLGVLGRRVLGIRLGRFYQYPPQPLSLKELACNSDKRDLPEVALVTPSFNQARFIQHTLASVREQRYPRLQYVVQDGLSTDGTDVLLKACVANGVDIRIEADSGQADALNRGFARTTGEVMGYLNSDDLLLPRTLQLVGRYFHDHAEVDVIYGNRLIVNEEGMEVGRWILPGHDAKVLRFVDYVPQESMFWRRQIWDRVGARFDSRLHFAMDWELILRFLDAGAVFHHVADLFGIFRVHGGQKSQANFAVAGASEMSTLRARHRDPNSSRFGRAGLHGRYLYEHRSADAAFQSTLCGG